MKWIAVGIDPGKTGAVAYLTNWGDAGGEVLDTANPAEILYALSQIFSSRGWNRIHAGIEKVSSMPGQGVASAFKFGGAFVGPQVACAAVGVPFSLVTPQRWNALCFEGRNKPEEKADRKKAVLRAARERWPQADLRLEKHGAVADALWIALYVARTEFGKKA